MYIYMYMYCKCVRSSLECVRPHFLVQSNFEQRSCFMVKATCLFSLSCLNIYFYHWPCSLPRELNQFVETTESVSTSGNKSKGEDMDACLEEVNKDLKVWQHGKMVALDWLRIFRNLGNLSKVCLPFLLACTYISVSRHQIKNAIYIIW